LIETLQELTLEYTGALEEYLLRGEETALRHAYELGRRAIAGGVGVLDILSIHNWSLKSLFANPVWGEQPAELADRASEFVAESLAAYEMALRGFSEANASLRSKIEQVQAGERELHRQNQQLIEAERSVKAERQRYQELFDFAPDAYLVTNLAGMIQEANGTAAELLQTPQDLLVDQSFLSFVAQSQREPFSSWLAKLQGGGAERVMEWEVTIQRRDGSAIPVSLRVGVFDEPATALSGLRWLLRDITGRKRLEAEQTQLQVREHLTLIETKAAQRLRFLAEVSTALASSLDFQSIPEIIALLSVPYFADCCFVHLIDDSMTIRHQVIAQREQGNAELKRIFQRQAPENGLPPPVGEVVRTGESIIVPEISESWLKSFANDSEEIRVLQQMNITSALIVPVLLPGRRLGSITFMAAAASERRYGPDDRVVADELARRCTLFLENARLYQEMVAQKDRAERASEAKEQFVAALSHEIRTPLMTVLGWAQILTRQPSIVADPVLSEGVRSLEHNAKNIARLVEDCLDVARIAEGKIQLQTEITNLNLLVNTAFEDTRELAYRKGLRFSTQFAPDVLSVQGDPTRLEQVILNLLANAIKFTENGEIAIALRKVESEAEIEVKDTGIGIAPEFLEQIFEPFRQGTANWYASESGLGLGLAIARKTVQLHGGRIWAESPGLGKGSTFLVRLPLANLPSEEETAAAPQQPGAPVRIKPHRVLFIEDSKDVLNLARLELESLGYLVYLAEDAKAGLEIAKQELPDVIVSDIKLPGFDGYALIEQIRNIPTIATTPAIALTGFGMQADIERSIQAGYNAHLSKPVEFQELSSLIEKLISP
jgi:PAS domain S-box-containing protein